MLPRVTLRQVVRTDPPVGVKLVQRRTATACFLRSARAVVVIRQSIVTVEAEAGLRGFDRQAVRVAADEPEPLRGRKVPSCLSFPAPGTPTRVSTELPSTRDRPSVNRLDGGGTGSAAKVAVTLRAPRTVTSQAVASPAQSPPQPLNEDPEAGAAVSVTFEERTRLAEQVAPQSMPAGVEVTVPLPVPSFVTESG